MSGDGGVCDVHVCLAWGGGSGWCGVNPVWIWVCEMCLCFSCGGVGGVGVKWAGGLEKGNMVMCVVRILCVDGRSRCLCIVLFGYLRI